MTRNNRNKDEDGEIWEYYLLTLVPDPQYKSEVEKLQVDEVTWTTYLLTSLKQLHGVFGAAIDRDIIQYDGLHAIVRIQKEDQKTFKSAILSFTTDLSSYGYENVKISINIKQVDKSYRLNITSDLQIIE